MVPQKQMSPYSRETKDHIAGLFDQDERNVKDSERGIVAIRRHVQALLHAFDPSICDWCKEQLASRL